MIRRTEEVKEAARSLHALGYSCVAIAAQLGVSKSSVHRWINPSAAELERQRSIARTQQHPEYWTEYYARNQRELKQYQKTYNKNNKKKVAKRTKKYRIANATKLSEYNKKYRLEKGQRIKERKKQYRQCNKGRIASANAARRAIKLKAKPPWLTPKQQKQIDAMFTLRDRLKKETGVPYHVDHIVPLIAKKLMGGKYVHVACGLHVPWNLQVVPAKQNLSKGPKLGILERG